MKKLDIPSQREERNNKGDLSKAKQQIENVADKTEKIGNRCFEMWEKGKNLNTARTGISAYKTVLHANSLLIRSKSIEG